MKKIAQISLHSFLFILLTGITQIGGVIYLISILVSYKLKLNSRWKTSGLFIIAYLFFTLAIVPYLAPLFGRMPIQHSEKVRASNYLTVILNRNYVTPELNKVIQQAEKTLKEKNSPIIIQYLDANFPFIKRFPLPPHLSHNDGEKVDISFVYENKQGGITSKLTSVSGYGVFVEPKKSEFNQTDVCKEKGYFQYDFPKYLSFGHTNDDIIFSKKGTKELMNAFLKQNKTQKIFIEPHLKSRLHLSNSKIRFHGCRAVRHDDHIHVQIK